MTKVKYYIAKELYDEFTKGKAYNLFTGKEMQKMARMYIKENYKLVETPIERVGELDKFRRKNK